MATQDKASFRVGVFVAVLLAAAGALLFLVGGAGDLLRRHYTLNAAWGDVSGLKSGAVVRLAGWDVGEVSAIRFSEDLGVKEIFVELKIREDFQARIRKDSEARIDTVGVLGDKYVAISIGDPAQPVLESGDWLNTRPQLDVLSYTKKVTEILESTSSIGTKVDLMLGLEEEAEQASLSRSFDHLEELLKEAKEGNGLLHALVYDESMPRRVNRTLANLEAMSTDVRHSTTALRTGDGLAHHLIYGSEGAELARDLGELATAIRTIADDIQNEESLVHALIYDETKTAILDDLAIASEELKRTSVRVSSGDGTLGMLANDPALYEDLRALMGGAQRNKLLRSMIRKTVERGEQELASPWAPVGDADLSVPPPAAEPAAEEP